MTDDMPVSFQAAASGLRAKRRALNNELADFLRSVKVAGLPTIEVFREKQARFESEWNDQVKANDNCLILIPVTNKRLRELKN